MKTIQLSDEKVIEKISSLLPLATLNKNGLLPSVEYISNFQKRTLQMSAIYKIAKMDYNYSCIRVFGYSTTSKVEVDFYIYRINNEIKKSANIPSFITLKTDTQKNIYISVAINYSCSLRFQDFDDYRNIVKIVGVESYPSDAFDVP